MGGSTQKTPNEDGSVESTFQGFIKKDYVVDGKLVMYIPNHAKVWKWKAEQAAVTPEKDRNFKWNAGATKVKIHNARLL